jgi:glycosyltransferase involved in cell wall biosynthesis
MKISIVLPIHNEYENLNLLLSEWNEELKKITHISFEFVLVEDGSTDGTKELIKKLEDIYPIINLSSKKKRGYTRAVLDGIASSNGDYILCTDSDNQIKVKSLVDNISKLPEENFFLIGCRNPRRDPINRIIYSKLFKVLHIILFKTKLKDPSCPFVIGKKKTFDLLPPNFLNMMTEGFWWGFIATCSKMKIGFREVSIEHFARKSGVASYGFFKLPGIILRNTIGLFKIKFSKINGKKNF